MKSEWFLPSHDPACKPFAENEERPIDVLFVGSYRHTHSARNNLLHAIGGLADRHRIELRLMSPKWKSINLRFLRRFPIPGWHFLPADLRKISSPPVFGLELYDLLGKTKIVFNAAIDMSGEYRSNMRIFEALGCGACMISDDGIYPPGLEPGRDFVTYKTEAEALTKIGEILESPGKWREFGRRGVDAMVKYYPKHTQWQRFQSLVSEL